MLTFSEKMITKACSMQKSLVLPESGDPRILKAARSVVEKNMASAVYLMGKEETIKKLAAESGTNIDGLKIIDPVRSEHFDDYAAEYYKIRSRKGISMEDAREKIKDPVLWGAMMVRKGHVDAMVAGSQSPTAKVLVAGFTIVQTAPGVKSASSCFVMDFPDKSKGNEGLMIFSDCATIPDPTVEQLAEIALASANSCRTFLQTEPLVAMLSFSTLGSASHPNVDKVLDALRIVKEKSPSLLIDGELQLDAAVSPTVGEKKAPGSPVAGKANTLIFPNLEAGNIGYKIAQQFSGAGAYGPFLQGFSKPVSDLSRGASVDDIVNTCAVTLTQVAD